ncbi:type IV pilus modification PilV family protein [Anaerocolumna xylanovorans]|uniref:Prepilin-type N-terminal cleavage/methylation domain-containing protein n=1 Tax=Anaerocolumna xylanovorans DSM 12503 TaxID=1121345 RepID=A0A1M7YMY2_9FIRM|nr:prepilin-type N-terminal cleavage/methylation domain-containing protein [Anaerocolumna xylanovorans]SHO53937.1 prepilin-type N-terminal cleavage/methylation domain-containing protein [Anaerocolumna xylanovorans DSM 12503]
MKQQRKKENNNGFSLVELLVSIVILAIITVPLLSYFVSSSAYNTKAKTSQDAVALSQSIIENCKDKSIEDIARSFHAGNAEFLAEFDLVPVDKIGRDQSRIKEVASNGTALTGGSYDIANGIFKNSDNGLLYYAIENIQDDGRAYDALITIDTNITSGKTYYDTNVNKPLYQIKAIQTPQNIIGVETAQEPRAVISMSDLNRSYCEQENAAHAGVSGWSHKVPVGETAIQAALCRNIFIEIEPYEVRPSVISTSQTRVKIYYKYYSPGIEGCPQDQSSALEMDPPLYQETVSLEDMKNIYVFFQRNKGIEQISLDIDPAVAASFRRNINLYLLCQAADEASDLAPAFDASINPVGTSYLKVDKVYSNAGKVSKSNDGSDVKEGSYISNKAVLRMMDIKVDVYKAGKLLNPDFLYASMNSTKGE